MDEHVARAKDARDFGKPLRASQFRRGLTSPDPLLSSVWLLKHS
jgi:hypothetical protein